MNEVERRFHQAMIAIYETAKRDLGYNAVRFLQMISEQGGLGAARQLLRSNAPSEPQSTDELGMVSGAAPRKVPSELG